MCWLLWPPPKKLERFGEVFRQKCCLLLHQLKKKKAHVGCKSSPAKEEERNLVLCFLQVSQILMMIRCSSSLYTFCFCYGMAVVWISPCPPDASAFESGLAGEAVLEIP